MERRIFSQGNADVIGDKHRSLFEYHNILLQVCETSIFEDIYRDEQNPVMFYWRNLLT